MSKKGRKYTKLGVYTKPEGDRSVNNYRGSALWQYNHFRISILTSLLNDITDLENEGMEENICQMVQKSLNYYINASTAVPQGGFLSGGPLYKEIENFHKIYVEWNGIEGKNNPKISAERRKKLSSLKKQRQRITDKVRRLQYELQNNLDQKILHDSYNAIGEMIGVVPNMFKNLSASYKLYKKYTTSN